MEEGKKQVSVGLPSDLYGQVERISKNHDWSMSKTALKLIKMGIDSKRI